MNCDKHISHTCICWFYYVNCNESFGSVKCRDRQNFLFFLKGNWSERLVRLSYYLYVPLLQHFKQLADFSRNLVMSLENTIQCNYLQSGVIIQRIPLLSEAEVTLFSVNSYFYKNVC